MTADELAGLVGLCVVLLLLGEALLYAAGIVRTPRAATPAAGLAIALGWAATGLLATAELLVGLRGSLVEILVGQAILAAESVVG
jgi:hypothetical protein